MSTEQALAFSKQKILRFWELTGQRGWARLILDRLHDLVLAPNDPKGSALDPDTVAHEHQNLILSRQPARCCQCCRRRLAQRRLKSLCVFCIMLFVKFPPWGGARKKLLTQSPYIRTQSSYITKKPLLSVIENPFTFPDIFCPLGGFCPLRSSLVLLLDVRSGCFPL